MVGLTKGEDIFLCCFAVLNVLKYSNTKLFKSWVNFIFKCGCYEKFKALNLSVLLYKYDTVSETKCFFASHDLYYSMILCQKQNISLHAMVCITV